MITVFTPTYNRAHLLIRLYQSLTSQTFTDFEWLLIDDGSTDNTGDVVQGFISENKISIRFHQCSNGGKHRAINRGVKEAQGELFFIVDSDDWLPEDSLEVIVKYYDTIKYDESFAGVSGHRGYPDGSIVGGGQIEKFIDANALDIRYKYHITGDLNEVFRTSVLREIPFPEYEGEKFCPEALVWNRIAAKYKLRYFDKITYIADYQPGGLTANIVRVRMQSPMASTTCYQELLSHYIPLKQKVKAAINYWRFAACLLAGTIAPRLPWYWRICQPIGLLMHRHDLQLLAH